MVGMSKFTDWVNEEVHNRGWTQNELARRAHVSSGHLSLVVTERQNPGWDFCAKVAQALGKPPEYALRLAGLLPSPSQDEGPTVQELREIVRRLPLEEQKDLLWYASALFERCQRESEDR